MIICDKCGERLGDGDIYKIKVEGSTPRDAEVCVEMTLEVCESCYNKTKKQVEDVLGSNRVVRSL